MNYQNPKAPADGASRWFLRLKARVKIRLRLGLSIAFLYGLPILAGAEVYSYKEGQTLVGQLQTTHVTRHETFLELAHHYKVAYYELREANPDVDPWTPEDGAEIIVPTQFILPEVRHGIHVNLAEYRLYYFNPDEKNKVWTFPISVGRGDWLTPIGATSVVDKLINPTWYPPVSIRKEHEEAGDPLPWKVPPGPDNPFGKYALQLQAEGYFIHGTNRPYGIGMKVTHGCIRMRPEDIASLFNMVTRQTPVFIEYRPFKSAVEDGVLYFEANADADYANPKEITPIMRAELLTDAVRHLLERHRTIKALNWFAIFRQAYEPLGIPYPVNLHHAGPVFIKAPYRVRTPLQAGIEGLPYLF